MPYPQRSRELVAAFCESQRPPPGSHLSAFLHGQSVVGRSRQQDVEQNTSGRGIPRRVTAPVLTQAPESLDGYYAPAADVRPRASTFSVIDPVHSPTLGVRRPGQSTVFYGDPQAWEGNQHVHPALRRAQVSECEIKAPPPAKKARRKHHHHRQRPSISKSTEKDPRRPVLFPKVTDPRVRLKSIGTLVTGTTLILVLTTYLALATSNAVPTTAFHVTFIFIIICLTIAFGHFLVRLCMLAFHPRGHVRNPSYSKSAIIKDSSGSSDRHHFISHPVISRPLAAAAVAATAPLRSPMPRSRQPIRLLPPYAAPSSPPPAASSSPSSSADSLPSAHELPTATSPSQPPQLSARIVDFDDDDKALPAVPPPAYGRWRGSVRIENPERISTTTNAGPGGAHVDLQQLTRELVLAGVRGQNHHRHYNHHPNRSVPPTTTLPLPPTSGPSGRRPQVSSSASASTSTEDQEPPPPSYRSRDNLRAAFAARARSRSRGRRRRGRGLEPFGDGVIGVHVDVDVVREDSVPAVVGSHVHTGSTGSAATAAASAAPGTGTGTGAGGWAWGWGSGPHASAPAPLFAGRRGLRRV